MIENDLKIEAVFKRLMKNTMILFSGNLWVSVLGLVSFAVTAKSLGAESFGLFVLVTTYVLVIDKLINFQAWRALIKYGSDSLAEDKPGDFKALVKLCTVIDVVSAVLATVVAVSAANFVGHIMNWSNEVVSMITMYSLVLLFRLSGSPTAILRIFDKFKTFIIRGVVSSSLKLIGVIYVFYVEGGITGYLFVWAIADIVGQLLLLIAGWKELNRQKLNNVFSENVNEISKKHPGFWSFVWAMCFDSTIYVGRELDVYIIGALLSLEEVALFKVAKQISLVLLKFIDPVYTAIYPELAKLRSAEMHKHFMALIKKSSMVLGGLMIIPLIGFLVLGDYLILTIFGNEYDGVFSACGLLYYGNDSMGFFTASITCITEYG